MDKPMIEAMAERLERLERECHRYRRLGIGLATLGVAALLAGAARQAAIPKEVAAESFVLRSPDGRDAAVWMVRQDGMPGLVLYDLKGNVRAVLDLTKDGRANLRFQDDGEHIKLALYLKKDGAPFIGLGDGKEGRVFITTRPDGSADVGAVGPDGPGGATLEIDKAGQARVVVRSKDGTVRFQAPMPKE